MTLREAVDRLRRALDHLDGWVDSRTTELHIMGVGADHKALDILVHWAELALAKGHTIQAGRPPQPERLTVDEYEFCETRDGALPVRGGWFFVCRDFVHERPEKGPPALVTFWARPKQRPDMCAGGTFSEKAEG